MAEMDSISQHNDQPDDRVRTLVEGGAEIAGGAVAAALGFLAGGPISAAAFGASGAAAVFTLKRVGADVSARLIGPRERVRLGAVLALAAANIQERVRRGDTLRQDAFFERKPGARSDADEVAEGVLLKSQREPEERKLPYMASLLANIAFDDSVSGPFAHQLTKAAEELTYRQFCLLKVAAARDKLGLRNADYRGQGSFRRELYQILYECHDLYQRGFISLGGEVAFGPTDVHPARMTPQGLGADLYNLLGLAWIADVDVAPLVEQLR
jgi:hypothetical protein